MMKNQKILIYIYPTEGIRHMTYLLKEAYFNSISGRLFQYENKKKLFFIFYNMFRLTLLTSSGCQISIHTVFPLFEAQV